MYFALFSQSKDNSKFLFMKLRVLTTRLIYHHTEVIENLISCVTLDIKGSYVKLTLNNQYGVTYTYKLFYGKIGLYETLLGATPCMHFIYNLADLWKQRISAAHPDTYSGFIDIKLSSRVTIKPSSETIKRIIKIFFLSKYREYLVSYEPINTLMLTILIILLNNTRKWNRQDVRAFNIDSYPASFIFELYLYTHNVNRIPALYL